MALDTAIDTEIRAVTPDGVPYAMTIRPGTSDANTVLSCAGNNNEYDLPRGLVGWALDVGAHIGACTVPLLLDNPELHAVAIEALPENVEILAENIRRNGLGDRASILAGPASNSNAKVTIGYGDLTTDFGREHQFIGSPTVFSGRKVTAKGCTLADVLKLTNDDPIAWMKIDCETCEYPFFESPLVGRIAYITGEHHAGYQRIVDLLGATHTVRMIGGTPDFGHFEAVRR
jgi:FkbM family methyltransferase